MSPLQIGFRIKERREQLGLTLEDIASSVKVSRSTIQRYEAGRISRPKLPVLYSISVALRVNPEWLLGISDDPTPATEAVMVDEDHALVDAYHAAPEPIRKAVDGLLEPYQKASPAGLSDEAM